MKIAFFSYLISAFLVCVPCRASTPEPWNTFKATSLYDGSWKVEQGLAYVRVTSDKIFIKIYMKRDESGSDTPGLAGVPDESIVGTISPNGEITAKESVSGSDANPVVISGHISKVFTAFDGSDSSKGYLFTRIVLTNAYLVIGFSSRTTT